MRDQLFMSPSWFIKSEGNRSAPSCYILQYYNTLTISVQIIMWTRRQFVVSQSAVRKETQESCCEKVVLRNPKMPIKQQQQQQKGKLKKRKPSKNGKEKSEYDCCLAVVGFERMCAVLSRKRTKVSLQEKQLFRVPTLRPIIMNRLFVFLPTSSVQR